MAYPKTVNESSYSIQWVVIVDVTWQISLRRSQEKYPQLSACSLTDMKTGANTDHRTGNAFISVTWGPICVTHGSFESSDVGKLWLHHVGVRKYLVLVHSGGLQSWKDCLNGPLGMSWSNGSGIQWHRHYNDMESLILDTWGVDMCVTHCGPHA